MGSLELTTVLQFIGVHRAKAYDVWQSLFAILSDHDEVSLYHYVRNFLQQQGFTTSLLSSDPTLLYSEVRYERAPTLLCYLDYDPQAPVTLQVEAIAGNLLALMTYQALLAARADISPVTLKWLLGQKNFTYTSPLQERATLLQADACLWYEPLMTERTLLGSPDKIVLATGCKGYLSVELQVQTTHIPLHSSHGAIVPSAAWRLLWALNSLKDQQEEILIEGFYDTVLPLEDEAFQQLANLPDTAAAQAEHWGIPELLMGLRGKQMHYAHILIPICTIDLLHSGEDAPVSVPITPSYHSIPATAKARVDFYLVPGQDPEDIFDKLKRHLRARGFSDVRVTLQYAGSPAYTSARHSFVQHVIQNTERVYDQSPILLPLLPEYVPISRFTQSSIPGIILPLYAPELQEQPKDEQQALWKNVAHLAYLLGNGW
jgi:Peptidase dimerisation domain